MPDLSIVSGGNVDAATTRHPASRSAGGHAFNAEVVAADFQPGIMCSIVGGPLHPIDHQHLHVAACRPELQSELLLQPRESGSVSRWRRQVTAGMMRSLRASAMALTWGLLTEMGSWWRTCRVR